MSQLGLGLGLTRGGGVPFNPLSLDPYLLFDTRSSMIGTFENPTLDLDPSDPDTLDVITATRSGVATYTDADGLIQSASADTVRVDYTQGEELTPTKFQRIENTDFSNWLHARTSDTANAAISPDGENNATYLEQNSGQTNAGSIYRFDSSITGVFTFSVYAKKKEKDFVVLYDTNTGRTYFNLDTGTVGTIAAGNTANIEDAGNGWFRCSVTFTASSGTVKAIYVGDTDNSSVVTDSGGIYIYGPQLEEGTTASDFVSNTTGSPKFITGATYGPRVPMILVEPSSENLWGWSEGTLNDYQTNAVLYGGQYLSTDATSRNGLNSWLYFQPSSDTQVGFRMPVSVTSGSTMILSFYVIMDDGSAPRVGTSSTGSDTDFAILLQGSSSAGVAGGVEHISGDLYRVWAYRVFTGTSNAQYIYRYATHSGKGFKISGVMLEESSVPTSYIPTSGSTVTRQADDLVITGSDFDFYNSSEGTFYVEAVPRSIDSGRYLNVSDGTPNNRLILYESSVPRFFVAKDSVVQAQISSSASSINTLNRLAASYKLDEFQISSNGASITTDTSGTPPPSVNRMNVGRNQDNLLHLNGHLKRLIYWPVSSDSL